jgi:hypothetical protein
LNALPEVVGGARPGIVPCRHREGRKVWLENRAKGGEEPARRVDLLLVLPPEAEDGHRETIPISGPSILSSCVRETVSHEMRGRNVGLAGHHDIYHVLRCILVYMRNDGFDVEYLMAMPLLVGRDGRDDAMGARIDLLMAVADDADDNLLLVTLAPGRAVIALA